eukprot:936114-Prymnesium_polylepis.1
MLQQRDAASSGRQRVAACRTRLAAVATVSGVLVGDRCAGRVIPHTDALARSVHLRALIIPCQRVVAAPLPRTAGARRTAGSASVYRVQ